MKTIDPNLLDSVTGGTTPPVSPGPTTGGSDSNSQVLSTLQNIESSIKDLGNNHNNSLFGGSNGAMLMMTMAFAMSRNNSTTVIYGGGGWHHHGWGFRAW
jgi:hypothetical protein